ncbi:MAG: alpha/beta fold hydrolase [Anaerolineae bacterium]|nr:alpha/beta fold hydrolase [Anaerolineae bacterium]
MSLKLKAIILACTLFVALLSVDLADVRAAPNTSKIKLEPCVLAGSVSAECGTLRVYEDRLTHRGRQIDLRVAVLRARSKDVLPDPIFFFAGGPGVPATADALSVANIFLNARQHRDVVLVDQRGTGGSHELLCPTPDPVKYAELGEGYLPVYVKDCLANLDGDPRFYTTAMAMDDVDEVRAALGYDQINIYGGSYGATAVQVYLRLHEDRVRSAVIAFGTLLDIPIFERMAYTSQLALDGVFERCEQDILCHATYPDLQKEFATVMQRLKEKPIATKTLKTGDGQPIMVNDITFAGAVHSMLLYVRDAARLPRLIHRIYTLGDVDSLMLSTPSGSIAPTLVMAVVIRCFETWASYKPDNIKKLGDSYLNDLQTQNAVELQKTCALLPDPGAAAAYPARAKSDVPVLILTGGADPQNPPENMEGYQQIWSNSLWVIFPDQGHNIDAPAGSCYPNLLSRFIEQGSGQEVDASCARYLSVSTFDITS